MGQLALSLRPSSLGEVIGQDAAKRAIESFAKRGNWPNVFLFSGLPGTGKTTLALIVAKMVGADESCTHEINASDHNGVDDARELADLSASSPFNGQRRVIILNEFHAYTTQAQDALKDPMEKNNSIWILTTDKPEKISLAIRSRASASTFDLKPLGRADVSELVGRVLAPLALSGEQTKIVDFLGKNKVFCPREILGVTEQYLAGVSLEETLHDASHEPLYKDVAAAVFNGNWPKAAGLLEQIKTADYRGMIAMVSAYLGGALLKESVGPKADALATCLVGLGTSNFADGVAYAATKGLLYKCAKAIGGK